VVGTVQPVFRLHEVPKTSDDATVITFLTASICERLSPPPLNQMMPLPFPITARSTLT